MLDRFWQDLKRRRVFRVAAAYVAVTFAGLEGAELILPRIGLPERVLTVLVLLAILGFPLVLVLAWLFELTPQGFVRVTPDAEAEAGSEALTGDRTDGTSRTDAPVRDGTRRPLRLAMLGGATVVFAAAALFWIPRSPAFRGVDVDASALVVLPFDVRGSEEVAYLREGMVDLLSTKLDGVGGLRVVDPQTTLARAPGSGEAAPSGDEARSLAAELGAGRALHGSVVWVGGSLQARAAVLGPADGEPIVASAEGSPDELFDLVDALVSGLVAGGMLENEAPLSSLEGLTTASTAALRLYLEGVRDFRIASATRHNVGLLDSALVLDSTFALAAYWAGYASEYAEIADPLPYYRQAVRHQDRLRTRDRLRLTAALAGAEGRYLEATRLYTGLTERYPDDVAAWFQLGEQLAHSGDLSGRTLDEALPVYERALALDPGLAPAYYHLAHILTLRGDAAGLATWAARADTAGLDSLWIAIPRMMHGLLVGDSAELARSFGVYRAAESAIPPSTIASSLAYLAGAAVEHAPAAARALMYEFADRALTDTARFVALRRTSRIEVMSGRFDEAERALPTGPLVPASLRAQDIAWIALHPDAGSDETSGERMRRAREALAAVRPATGSGEAAARHYLLGMLWLAAGQPEAMRAARDSLSAFRGSSSDLDRFASDLAIELETVVKRAEGEPDEALETLLRATYWERTQDWLGVPDGSFWWGRQAHVLPAFLRAELLRESGREEEADLWYRVAADGIWFRAAALRELAGIRERRGRSEEARALRARVTALQADRETVS